MSFWTFKWRQRLQEFYLYTEKTGRIVLKLYENK